MSEPTPTQYANFGEATAGILDGYLFDADDWTEEDRNSTFVQAVMLAASVYGIDPKEHPDD